ncbi:MAG TPA: hypothetical protein VMI54_08285 [Polyangiaceae bacterium]|nr:hypothetical protein [Polyangiaceae bacterium]
MRRDIEVFLQFVPTSEGGRSTPVWTGYRAQVHYANGDWDAMHEYPDDERVLPGQRVRAFLHFLSPAEHLGKVVPGLDFEIREGSRVVAHGRVERLVDLRESAIRARLHDALEEYYLKLGSSASDETNSVASDLYRLHLRQARKLRDVLASDAPLVTFEGELIQEQRCFGRSSLPGEAGDAVKAAFNAIVRLFDTLTVAGDRSNEH